MHFDVPKFFQSPGCDYGHDEESQNGRDIKIDILDHVARSAGGLMEPTMGHRGERDR